MLICLGYNVSESSLNRYFKDKNKNKLVRILGARVLDLDTFETLDVSLDDIVENRISIGGSVLDYSHMEKSVYVYMGHGKIEYFQGGEYNLVVYEVYNLSRPAFCNGELVYDFPNCHSFRSRHIVNYMIGYFDLYINITTSGILVKAYGFDLLNIDYTDYGVCPVFSDSLDTDKFSLCALDISSVGGIEYINNILAYVKDPLDNFTYVVNNGVKYIAVGRFSNSFTLVVPPSVEDIHFLRADTDIDKRYNILVSKEKYSLLVDKIYDNIEIRCDNEDSIAEKLKIINSLNIEVSTYG